MLPTLSLLPVHPILSAVWCDPSPPAALLRSLAPTNALSQPPDSPPAPPTAAPSTQTNFINDAFVQAREDIADAKDEAETVYFNESHQVGGGGGAVGGSWVGGRCC